MGDDTTLSFTSPSVIRWPVCGSLAASMAPSMSRGRSTCSSSRMQVWNAAGGNFGTTPRGLMSKREPQIIRKPTIAKWCSNAAKSTGWTKSEPSAEGTSSKSRSSTAASRRCRGRSSRSSTTSRTTELRRNRRATPLRCALLCTSRQATVSLRKRPSAWDRQPWSALATPSWLRNQAVNDSERVADERSLMTAGSAPIARVLSAFNSSLPQPRA
jgi:hypothetical protein